MLIIRSFLVFIFLFLTYTVMAQDLQDGVCIDSSVYYLPSTRAKSMEGSIEIIDAKDEISYGFKLFDQLPITLALEARYISLKKDVHVSLPNKLTGIASYFDTTVPFFNVDNTYLRLGISPSFYTDNWACYSSAFRIPSWACAIYQYSKELTVIIGVAVLIDYELEAAPLVGIIYKPNDRWLVSILPWKDSQISYKANDIITIFMEGNFTADEFEVTRAKEKGVILCYQDIKLGTGVNFTFNKYINASIALGGVFYRSLYYRDSIGKINLNTGLYTESKVNINF